MLARAGASLGLVWVQRAVAACSLPSTSYSSASAAACSSDATVSEDKRRGTVNKLLYHSKQRGFLELDLLVGLWAESNIPQMDMKQLNEMAGVLDEENPDLFKWLTGQLPPPEHMTQNSVFVALRKHVAQQIEETAAVNTRASVGRDWVRGWDDGWRGAKKDDAAAPQAQRQ